MALLASTPGRYVLYGGITCPFTHRALLARALRGLETSVRRVLANPVPGASGWEFDARGGPHSDPVLGARSMRDIYLADDSAFSGRPSVPLLWDAERGGIVSHSSREIVLLLNSHPQADGPDLYPGAHSNRIDADVASFDTEFVAAIIRAASTGSQAEYEQAVRGLFGWLDRLDERLAGRRYLGGPAVDLADLAVFTGLVRFDTCYYFGSRCHLRRIQDYPNLWGYVCDIYQLPGVSETVDFDAYRRSFFSTSPAARDGIIPLVPEIDFSTPQNRAGIEDVDS